MPTFNNLDALDEVRGKLNNSITRTDAAVVVADAAGLAALTYTAGSAWTVASGDFVVTAKEGYFYSVMPSDEASPDVTVAGGAKLNVIVNGNGEYNFRAMLPAANGSTDDYAKFAKLLAKDAIDGKPPLIFVPYGTYYMGQTINLKTPARIRGDHSAFGADSVTKFVFPAATAGIIVNRFNTLGDATVDAGGSADGAQIIGLHLEGGRGSAFDETQSGIWMRARARIVDCTCINFAGHGIYNAAGSDGNPYLGNTNLAIIEHVYCEFNRGNGVHLEGTDANAGNVLYVNVKGNDGWGVYEDSFLQNTHIGHHAIDNDAGSYFSSNQSPLIGSYSEDGNGSNAEWAGTMIGCQISTFNGVGPKLQTEQANGPKALRNDNGGFRGTHATGSTDIAAESGTVLAARHTTPGISYPFRVNWETDGSGVFVRWASSGTQLMKFNGTSTAATYGRSAAVGESINIPSLFLGLNNSARAMSYESAAPTSGEWARGDIVFNNAPSASGKIGWVCTTGGTPGTWKTWGAIDA